MKGQLFIVGTSSYVLSGSLSLYQSFRDAVERIQHLNSDYAFLGQRQTTLELVQSPWRVSYLKNFTTLLPLVYKAVVSFAPKEQRSRNPTGRDFGFSLLVSHNPGIGEEAVYRGYLQPVLRSVSGNSWVANSLQAFMFMATHYPTRGMLLADDFLIAFYWGWLTEHNAWSISESIFIHYWGDVIALNSTLISERRGLILPLPNLYF
jgi:membrane protease YdiL (CAAX protease family)